MKYYSEITKSLYESEKELMAAETKVKQEQEAKKKAEAEKRNARAADAKAVEEAHKAMVAAQERYNEAVNQFVKKYGSYHLTVSNADDFPHVMESLLSLFRP